MFTTMHGTIEHRLLVNWAADPEVIAPLLPAPFRPQLVRDQAVVGICALRLTHLRPAHLPAHFGVRSDNAAHRVAVEWDTPNGLRTGVWVLRRDSAQRLPVLIGGRLFPGVHGPARFVVEDQPEALHIAFQTADDLEMDATVRPLDHWCSRLFATPADASDFFALGSRGFSADHRGCAEGVDLITPDWRAEPVAVDAHATWFDETLPPGSTRLDGALLLRELPVTWSAVPSDQQPG